MELTTNAMVLAIVGTALMTLLFALQLIAVVRPESPWTIKNVFKGDPDTTDRKAYFAFNKGLAWADVIFWGPLQFASCIGILACERWGYVFAMGSAVPFIYTGITLFVWDREMGIRESTTSYWALWAVFPVFGAIQFLYCSWRLL
ncbi:hypothetical protein OAU50_03500 [Planctomycetota bacterium]|nr:hypothetical protein [Planctomycetota bacterium]